MTPEEIKAKAEEILKNLADQGSVSTLLAEITEGYTKVSAEFAQAKADVEKVNADNETLRQANMSLFLKVGETKTPETEKVEEDTTPKFEDLFDKEGNIL